MCWIVRGSLLVAVPSVTSCRWMVAYLVFTGCIVIYLMRINMSVAVVCMTNDVKDNDTLANESFTETKTAPLHNEDDDCPNIDDSEDADMAEREFDWDRQLRGWLLSAFFYGYAVTQLPSAWLVRKTGAKWLLLGGIGLTTVATMLTPVAARASVYLFIMLRVIKGIGSGVYYPCVAHLWCSWAPPQDRSKLVASGYSGASFGNILSFAVSGLLCEYGFDGGWPSVFYVCGSVSVVWLVLLSMLLYNSPEEHPRISEAEKQYILKSMNVNQTKLKEPIPWRHLLTSGPVWTLCIVDLCYGWGLYTLLTSLPQYLYDVLKFDIAESGVYNALPYLCQLIYSIFAGYMADEMIKRGVSRAATRKIIETLAMSVPAIFLIGTAFLDCHQPMVAVGLLCVAVGLSGGHRAGPGANQLDIAPRHAGVIAPTVNSALVPLGTQAEWQKVFFLTAGIQIFGSLLFLVFGQGEVQDWAKVPITDHPKLVGEGMVFEKTKLDYPG